MLLIIHACTRYFDTSALTARNNASCRFSFPSITSNTAIAIVVVLGLGSIGFLAARGPREHGVRIDERGISIDGTRSPYPSIHSFWIERGVAEPRLFITMNGVLSPHFSLPITHKDEAVKIHQHLSRFIQEEEQGPHWGEHVTRLLGL